MVLPPTFAWSSQFLSSGATSHLINVTKCARADFVFFFTSSRLRSTLILLFVRRMDHRWNFHGNKIRFIRTPFIIAKRNPSNNQTTSAYIYAFHSKLITARTIPGIYIYENVDNFNNTIFAPSNNTRIPKREATARLRPAATTAIWEPKFIEEANSGVDTSRLYFMSEQMWFLFLIWYMIFVFVRMVSPYRSSDYVGERERERKH